MQVNELKRFVSKRHVYKDKVRVFQFPQVNHRRLVSSSYWVPDFGAISLVFDLWPGLTIEAEGLKITEKNVLTLLYYL